jgi:hypothetical protein
MDIYVCPCAATGYIHIIYIYIYTYSRIGALGVQIEPAASPSVKTIFTLFLESKLGKV